MREKGQTEVAKTLETPVFSRGIEILTEKFKLQHTEKVCYNECTESEKTEKQRFSISRRTQK